MWDRQSPPVLVCGEDCPNWGETTARRALHNPAMLPPQKLARPLPTKDGGILRTAEDARTYMLKLPKHRQIKGQWQHAVALMLTHGDIVDLIKQIELALFYDAQLDVAAMV